jgi:hypothetical protein
MSDRLNAQPRWRAVTAPQRAVRLCCLAVAAASAGGLVTLSSPEPSQADDDVSSVTVAWAGGNGVELQAFQPDRDPDSVHYEDFADVEVTVDQTTGLVDQVVTVEVTGMPGRQRRSGLPSGVPNSGRTSSRPSSVGAIRRRRTST